VATILNCGLALWLICVRPCMLIQKRPLLLACHVTKVHENAQLTLQHTVMAQNGGRSTAPSINISAVEGSGLTTPPPPSSKEKQYALLRNLGRFRGRLDV
jgi:hypothetical protein